MNTEPELKYCLYARKSSESDERQAMSIDSQLAEMRALASSSGLNVVCELQESYSAKESGKRPVYNQLLKGLRGDEYNAVLTWAPDRLSRNAGDLGSIVDLMDQGKLLHIKTYSQTFTNNPNEKFLLMILCSQAKLENDNKSINVKRGIKTKCEMGWRPGVAPLGYMNRAFGGIKDIVPDPDRADIITEMFRKAGQEGWSGRKLKDWLDGQDFRNRSGLPVMLSQVLAILINPFYYGEFQYPESPGGKWFKGAHKPLVSKELFDLVQQTRGVNKGVWGSKQFAFRGLISCGQCGASFTAQEKFKKLKNGDYNRHVYYSCTRRVDPNCKEKYINETNFCLILQDFIEQNYNGIRISSKLRAKVERHYSATKSLFAHYKLEQPLDKPFIEYSRYVLDCGSESEKTALAAGIETKLKLTFGALAFVK
ncbi:MAG TPA: recombinase family protein [Candidatus Saccharimonadales bacterium]|jgi:DNA invertase Pin-like site-specific DNA recombinase/predicted metal-binding protein